MAIFGIIPDNLFAPLAGPLRKDYAQILMNIYELYKIHPFSIEREVITSSAIDYLESIDTLDLSSMDTEELSSDDSRGRALWFIRQLEAFGWIDIETKDNYKQYVTLPDYSIELLDTFDQLQNNRRQEFKGLVYATYSVLASPDTMQNRLDALEQAHRLTMELVRQLKSLSHNIKTYIERVTKSKTPKELLEQHFEQYMTEIIDQRYHRLKTSDSVYKYRPKIIAIVSEWSNNDIWIEQTAKELAKRYSSSDELLHEPKTEIRKMLNYIETSYRGMDTILKEIDRRNSQYTAASRRRIEYMLTTAESTEGQLQEILKYFAKETTEAELELIQEGFSQIYDHNFLDDQSLFTPRSKAKTHEPLSLDRNTSLSETQQKEKQERLLKEMQNQVSIDKVNTFILDLLQNKTAIAANEIRIESTEILIYLIYALVFKNNRQAKYKISFGNTEVVSLDGQYLLPNFMITIK